MKTTFLKWMVVVAGAGLATAIIHPRLARSADHLDAPATTAEAAADINDVYTFLDGSNVVFAMTTHPAAAAGSKFSDAVQYAFHTTSGAAFGAAGTSLDIICTFDAAQKVQCWAGADEYVTGDASAATGITSASGKFKVFAGLRADPFFFNLEGFRRAVKTVDTLIDGGVGFTIDPTGCPTTGAGTAVLQPQLQQDADGGAGKDFFKNLNGLAIVVSLDKGLVNKGGPISSVWASTHRKP